MTRLVYGQDTQGPTWNPTTGTFAPNASISFYTAATGGSAITDLLNAVGGAVTTITSNSDGSVPQFSGPTSGQGSSTAPGMWASSGANERLWYDVQNKSAGIVGIGSVLAANNGSDFQDEGTVRYNLHIESMQARVVSVPNVAALTGKPTIDGYTVTNNDLILLVGQTSSIQNGLWQVPATGSGAWARPTVFPSGGVVDVRTCDIGTGTTFAGTHWALESATSTTIDTSAQNWISEYAQLQNLGSIASMSPTGTASAATFLRGDGAWAVLDGSYVFCTTGATVSTSFAIHVPNGCTIGLCTLQGSPSGANITVILQTATTISGTYSTVQSLTISSGSTTPVTGTPSGGAQTIAAGNYVRVSCTAAGGATPAMFQAEYA